MATFGLVMTIGTVAPIFATHTQGVQDYEWHVWSRSSSDGHRNYLNCGSGSQSDNCDLKIKTLSGGIQIHSQSTINDEIDAVENHFDDLNKKMSIDRITTANSYVTEYNLPSTTTGKSEYELHCTNWHSIFWWW